MRSLTDTENNTRVREREDLAQEFMKMVEEIKEKIETDKRRSKRPYDFEYRYEDER